MKLKKIFSLLIFLSVATTCFSQSAGSYMIEREINLSKDGYIFQISDGDTLRCDTLVIPIWDNYIIQGIAMSSIPAVYAINYLCHYPLHFEFDTTSGNPILSSFNFIDNLYQASILFTEQSTILGDTNNYKINYEYFDTNISTYYNYLLIYVRTVYSDFKSNNKVHFIIYLQRFI